MKLRPAQEQQLMEKWLLQNLDVAKRAANKVKGKAPTELDVEELEAMAMYNMTLASQRFPDHCRAKGGYVQDTEEYEKLYRGYCWKRSFGSLLDYLRSIDSLSRPQRDALNEAGQEGSVEEKAERAGVSVQFMEDVVYLAKMMSFGQASTLPLEVGPTGEIFQEKSNSELSMDEEVISKVFLGPFLYQFVELVRGWDAPMRKVFIAKHYVGLNARETAEWLGMSVNHVWPLHERGLFQVLDVVESLAAETAASLEESY